MKTPHVLKKTLVTSALSAAVTIAAPALVIIGTATAHADDHQPPPPGHSLKPQPTPSSDLERGIPIGGMHTPGFGGHFLNPQPLPPG